MLENAEGKFESTEFRKGLKKSIYRLWKSLRNFSQMAMLHASTPQPHPTPARIKSRNKKAKK